MLQEPYLVSILIPVFRVENYIERCGRSLFNQTYHNLEYIFVDDCSPDNSIKLLKKIILDYPERNGQIKILRHERNRGLAAARNTAVAAARGEFVVHVDSDDWMEPQAIEWLVQKQVMTNADIVTGNSWRHFSDHIETVNVNEFDTKEDEILAYIKPTLQHVIWSRLIRRSLYTEHGIKALEGTNIGEDWQVVPQLVYYAHSSICLHQRIYHYDCTNEQSYMNEEGVDKQRIRHLQDFQSLYQLYQFLYDKGHRYVDLAEHYLDRYAFQLLYDAVLSCNLKLYQDTKKVYRDIPQKQHFKIVPNTRFNRYVAYSYYLALAYLKFNELKAKFAK